MSTGVECNTITRAIVSNVSKLLSERIWFGT